MLANASAARAQADPTADATGRYEFVTPEDTLGLLDEDGMIRGYLDKSGGAEESDDIIGYKIVDGSHAKGHIEFKTNKIHETYYRFSGKVQRGTSAKPDDPDYLRLAGKLDIVKVDGDTGKETVETRGVVMKSKGKTDDSGDHSDDSKP
jgi:hypothetical protein